MADLFSRIARSFSPAPQVTVLRLSGVIAEGGRFQKGLSDAALAALIERAFKPKKLAAVALAINSPGGSAAQSALIAGRIRDFAAEKKVPVLAFCEDVAASGGYWLACAADEIFVERNSIVGSIGVISASFGFAAAMDRLGVERRLQTAGEAKARLDPFSPLKAEDVAWLTALQERIHGNFIDMVRGSRGGRLDVTAPNIFSGEVFLGEEAVRLGLADGIGRLRPVLRERFGEKVRIAPVEPQRGLFSRLSPFSGGGQGFAGESLAATSLAAEAGAGAALSALEAVEARALWARYGL